MGYEYSFHASNMNNLYIRVQTLARSACCFCTYRFLIKILKQKRPSLIA